MQGRGQEARAARAAACGRATRAAPAREGPGSAGRLWTACWKARRRPTWAPARLPRSWTGCAPMWAMRSGLGPQAEGAGLACPAGSAVAAAAWTCGLLRSSSECPVHLAPCSGSAGSFALHLCLESAISGEERSWSRTDCSLAMGSDLPWVGVGSEEVCAAAALHHLLHCVACLGERPARRQSTNLRAAAHWTYHFRWMFSLERI